MRVCCIHILYYTTFVGYIRHDGEECKSDCEEKILRRKYHSTSSALACSRRCVYAIWKIVYTCERLRQIVAKKRCGRVNNGTRKMQTETPAALWQNGKKLLETSSEEPWIHVARALVSVCVCARGCAMHNIK